MEVPLTRLPLAEPNDLLGEAQALLRKAQLVADLKVDLPALRALKASELCTAEVVTDGRLWLVFLLREPIEPDMFRDTGTASERRRRFLQDTERVRGQLKQVEWRIREAISEASSPLVSTNDPANESSTRDIRARVRRAARGGRLWIPGIDGPVQIEVGSLPRVLSRAPAIRISAHVRSMSYESALLRDVVVEPSDQLRANAIPGLHRCGELRRCLKTAHLETGALLQRAMDTRSRICLDVSVVLDWVDGSAMHFKIRAE